MADEFGSGMAGGLGTGTAVSKHRISAPAKKAKIPLTPLVVHQRYSNPFSRLSDPDIVEMLCPLCRRGSCCVTIYEQPTYNRELRIMIVHSWERGVFSNSHVVNIPHYLLQISDNDYVLNDTIVRNLRTCLHSDHTSKPDTDYVRNYYVT